MPKITLPKGKVSIPKRIGGTVQLPGAIIRTPAAAPAAPANPWDRYMTMMQSTVQTPAQIQATAKATALANERAVLAAQKAQSNIEVGRLNDQSSRAQGFARALGQLQAAGSTQARDDYLAASKTIEGLGTGLTGAVAAAEKDSQDRAAEAVAKMTGGLGQTSGPDIAGMRNAALYSGVTVPATSFAESAANAAAMARSEAMQRTGGIAGIARDYRAQADQAIREAGATARAEVAKRPASISALVQQLTDNRQAGVTNLANLLGQRVSYDQAQAKLKADAAQRVIENARATRQLDITDAYLTNSTRTTGASLTGVDPLTGVPTPAATAAASATANDKASRAAQWSNYNGYKSNPDGSPKIVNGKYVPMKGYKLTANGQGVVPIPKPGSGTAAERAGGVTPGLIKDTQKTIRDGLVTTPAGQIREADAPDDQQLKDANGNPTGFVADPNHPGKPAVQYADALANAIAGGPNTAKWRARATQLVNAAYAEGTNGRPWSRAKARAAAIGSARLAYKNGMRIEDLRARLETAALPESAIAAAIRTVYYGPARSPIEGIPPTSPDYPGG